MRQWELGVKRPLELMKPDSAIMFFSRGDLQRNVQCEMKRKPINDKQSFCFSKLLFWRPAGKFVYIRSKLGTRSIFRYNAGNYSIGRRVPQINYFFPFLLPSSVSQATTLLVRALDITWRYITFLTSLSSVLDC